MEREGAKMAATAWNNDSRTRRDRGCDGASTPTTRRGRGWRRLATRATLGGGLSAPALIACGGCGGGPFMSAVEPPEASAEASHDGDASRPAARGDGEAGPSPADATAPRSPGGDADAAGEESDGPAPDAPAESDVMAPCEAAPGCPSGAQCLGGFCVCPAGTLDCDGTCTACAVPPNGVPVCVDGGCGFTCAGGFTACGGSCVDLQGDAANCGACGHGCLGGACVAGQCQPVQTATVQGARFLTIDSGRVYFTASNASFVGVMSCVVAGCGASPVPIVGNQNNPWGVAVSGGVVFWADQQLVLGSYLTGAIRSVALPIGAGSTPKPASFMTGVVGGPFAVAVDSGSLFWTDDNGDAGRFTIAVTSLSARLLFADTQTPASNAVLALDAASAYWTSNTAVLACGRSGCTQPTVLATTQNAAAGLASDGAHVYWSDPVAGTIQTCPVAGCATATTLQSGLSAPGPMLVDGSTLYWNTTGDGVMWRLPLVPAGLPAQRLAYAGPAVAMTQDATSLYWTTSSGIMRLAK